MTETLVKLRTYPTGEVHLHSENTNILGTRKSLDVRVRADGDSHSG